MAKRECPSLQKSLDWCEGMPQFPGIRRRVYFCNKNLIVAWPTLQRDSFGRVTDAKYVGNFELAEGAFWQYIDINIDKSTVTSEPQGEVPSQTQLNKATFVHNGIDDEATAAAGFLNNSDNVYVYETMEGYFRVLGNDKWRTLTKTAQDQGMGNNPASTTISVEVTDEIAAPFYLGTLVTEDGEVSPSNAQGDDEQSYAVTPASLQIESGASMQLSMTPSDGWSFTSTKEDVATVSANGLVTAVAQGTAKINCSHEDGVTSSVSVTVLKGLNG